MELMDLANFVVILVAQTTLLRWLTFLLDPWLWLSESALLDLLIWEDIFNLCASAAVSEFCEWVQVGIDVYIPHRKYQAKPHSSPSFSAACAAAIVHKNHFFSFVPTEKNFWM